MGELFVRNLPLHATHVEFENFIRPYMKNVGVHTFFCQKQEGKDHGNITIHDLQQVQDVLNIYQTRSPRYQARATGGLSIVWDQQFLSITRSKRPTTKLRKQALQYEEQQRRENLSIRGPPSHSYTPMSRIYPYNTLTCGVWAGNIGQPAFSPQSLLPARGFILFGRTMLAILVGCQDTDDWQQRVDISYLSIQHTVTGRCGGHPTLTFTLVSAPRIVKTSTPRDTKLNPKGSAPTDVADILSKLHLGAPSPPFNRSQKKRKTRVTHLEGQDESIAASCFVYQLKFDTSSHIQSISELLHRHRGLPSSVPIDTASIPRSIHSDLKVGLSTLSSTLGDTSVTGHIPFGVRFQLQRLATNGILPPQSVLRLLSHVGSLAKVYGANATAEALSILYLQIPLRNPSVRSDVFRIETLAGSIAENAARWRLDGSIYDLKNRHEHVALIHRVLVTPAGVYLDGPRPEVKNRILRRYKSSLDYFVRVTFADEDGEQLRATSGSTEEILWQKFIRTLDGTIKICGHAFTFLGFSHSALRTQTCWFMAPFVSEGSLIHAQEVIKDLGNFSSIRTPAKCAARIGQAFSDTTASIRIDAGHLQSVPDVERNGRCFSDGCGTISLELLRKVWKEYKVGGHMKPTLLQIRLGGAKGMLSLDQRLKGEQVFVRPSMVKFEASGDTHLEVCGGNLRPLPLYLNRQFIKILEDLGVDPEYFIKLQSRALTELELITTSGINAANYLDANKMCLAQQLPSLLRLLGDLGLNFTSDLFLRNCVDLAALIQLRDLKYRGRILVERGVTLYGIMDETGLLEEGQIYCVTETRQGGREVLTGGQVAITRAPALHPGDIQLVSPIDVPDDSPLNALHNCVVFSSKGARDLPSQLSGGDLDGDIFNIIYDSHLIPHWTHAAADYPRVMPLELDREVVKTDMTEFFVEFMESDKLGTISNIHQQLADRSDDGTVDPICIKLAELASTAVDFSKTGIPVHHTDIPKFPDRDIWPDFMAPGPRVEITAYGPTFEDENIDPKEKDIIAELDPSMTRKYVRSEKILGRLYRNIDERRFFADLKRQGEMAARQDLPARTGLIDVVWDYVLKQGATFQYDHYLVEARDIKNVYESNMLQTMQQYSVQPSHPITEMEVFSGSIAGKTTGAQSKQVRECTKEMRERFDRDVAYTREMIMRGEDSDASEALPRAMACLKVSLEKPNTWIRSQLVSFRYVAAEICLREIWKMGGNRLRRLVPRTSVVDVVDEFVDPR